MGKEMELKCSGMRGTFQIPLANEGSSPSPPPAPKSANWGRLNEFFMINPDLGSQSVDSNPSPVLGAV